MSERPILVVGAGPAGLRAAIELARAGQSVLVADQAPGIGGAVYAGMRAADPAKAPAHLREIEALRAGLAEQAPRIEIRCGTVFAGLDRTGAALLTGAGGELLSPRALVLATGARERVRPRPGWTDPRVTTAGAVQVALKTGGQGPRGHLVLAGTGPLLFAIGAQLVRAGHPPKAILVEGRPFAHPFSGLRLPPAVLLEAAGYMLTLKRAGVPIHSATRLERIESGDSGLRLTTTRAGQSRVIEADHVALHDGLAPNDYGLPDEADIPVLRAGDCREVLGRTAAELDGRRVAAEVLARLGFGPKRSTQFARYGAAQDALATMFAPASGESGPPSDETILCRCEGVTLGELRAALDGDATARTLRLNARVGMGPCQGRFCLDWVAELATPGADPAALSGRRWPIRPVSVADILSAPDRRMTDDITGPETAS